MSPKPPVTIIITPRERYSRACESLASVVLNTPRDHRVIYVSAGAPQDIQECLKATCAQHGFEYISRTQFISPNVARNIGIAHADTEYLIFLDNDVIVQAGWVESLVDCAEQEGADIVSPVVLMGEPSKELFHSFGGRLIVEELGNGKKRIRECHHPAPFRLGETPIGSTRVESHYAEFHCALVRRSIFQRIGLLDEGITGAAEHVDLALHIRALGGKGVAEPTAVVTYLPTTFVIGDLSTYAKRWSEDWYNHTMDHLASKWNLDPASLLLSDYRSSFHELRERCLLPREISDPEQRIRIKSVNLAQTIVQLLDQLKALGYPDDALQKISHAYSIATQLFAGSFRSSGRTFLAHLIGTGSVLSRLGSNPAVIAAAILHAAYVQGQFPSGFDKNVGMMRRWLRRRMGDAVEDLVFLYSRLDLQEVATFVPRELDSMPIPLANAILIRIANSIENRISGDHRYLASSDGMKASNALVDSWMPTVAEKLGCGHLIRLLAEAVEVTRSDPGQPPFLNFRPFNYFVDPATGEVRRLPSRNIQEAKDADGLRSPDVSSRRSIRLSEIVANNGGAVSRTKNGVEIETVAQPWAYSASVDLRKLSMFGPAVIEVSLWVKRGKLGILVLERGSSEHLLVPELSVNAGQDSTMLKIEIPEMDEVGGLNFRPWPSDDLPAQAVVSAVSVISISNSRSAAKN